MAGRAGAASRSSSGSAPGGRGEPVPLRAHQRDDLIDLGLGHAIGGLIASPRRHRPLVGVDVAVGQQVQALVEHLPVELVARQALPAALAEDFQYRPGVLHYAYLTVPLTSVTCAPSPCGPALPVSRIGRALLLRLLRALCRHRTRVP